MTQPSLYADLSRYYDLLCSTINYQEQCAFAFRANQLLGNGGRRHLDLACGSGAHLEHFINANFSCIGVDISEAMLALAAQRCPNAHLLQQDMSELNLVDHVDFITCFLYSLHYSHPLTQYKQTLQKVFNALAPGGLFCFDAVDKNTVANPLIYTHKIDIEQKQFEFQTRWNYVGTGDTLSLHIDIHDQHHHFQEQHRMTAVSVLQIKALLENIGFTVAIFEREFNRLESWRGSNGNVLFCAVKQSP